MDYFVLMTKNHLTEILKVMDENQSSVVQIYFAKKKRRTYYIQYLHHEHKIHRVQLHYGHRYIIYEKIYTRDQERRAMTDEESLEFVDSFLI